MAKKEVARSYHLMEYYFRVAVFLNAVPFHYDYLQKIWAYKPRSVKAYLWLAFTFGGINAEFINVTAELVRGFGDPDVSQGEWCLVFFIFLSWLLITKLHWNVLLHGDEIVAHLNQTLRVRQSYTEAALPPSSEHKIVRGHISTSVPQCFVQCLMVAIEGSRRQYIYSHVPEEYRNGATQALWSVYCTWRVITNFQVGYFFLFVGIFHVQTVTQLLEYRKLNHEFPFQKLKSYRMVQFLCSAYNEAHAKIFMPSITIFAAANIILGNYGTLRFAGKMPLELVMNFPLMTIMMILLVFTFYPKNATVREASEMEMEIAYNAGILSNIMATALPEVNPEKDVRSKPIVEGIKRGQYQLNGRKNMENFVVLKEVIANTRSCRPVAVHMGGFSAIKKSTVLSIFQFIISNTISALLTWQ